MWHLSAGGPILGRFGARAVAGLATTIAVGE